jgi:hypothetical protein
MNKLFKYVPFAVFFLLISLNSCSNDEDLNREEVSAEKAVEMFELKLESQGYNKTSFDNLQLYAPVSAKNMTVDPNVGLTTLQAESLLLPMAQPTNDFLLDVGFSQAEINDLFDTEEEKASMGLLFYNILQQANVSIPQAKHGDSQTVDCLLEATGVTGAIGAIGLLAGQALTKTVIKKAVLTLAKTVGKRVIGAIGLAIMVGEFIWCMNRD